MRSVVGIEPTITCVLPISFRLAPTGASTMLTFTLHKDRSRGQVISYPGLPQTCRKQTSTHNRWPLITANKCRL